VPDGHGIRRIHFVGAAGSGATSLGRALAERLGCRHFDTDDYFWLPTNPPFSQPRDLPDRRALLAADLARYEDWVLSGSLSGWGDLFIPWIDLVVFLWVPTAVRLARLTERERQRFGEASLGPGGAMYEIHSRFMAWAAAYDTGDLGMRSRARHEAWLAGLPCPVLRIEGDEPLSERLARIVRYLGTAAGQSL
jgi:adenylate kinase family enzyme